MSPVNRHLDLATVTVKVLDRMPEDLRWGVRDRLRSLRIAAGRASLWRWTAASLRTPAAPCRIVYLGRPESLPHAARFLSARAATDAEEVPSGTAIVAEEVPSGTAIVAEQPFPFALCTPLIVRLFIELGDDLEQTLARMKWRRPGGAFTQALRLAERAQVVPVVDGACADRVSIEMLEAYAEARHGDAADHLPHSLVRQLARKGGLVLVMVDGEAVGARLSFSYLRHGKRYFQAFRYGYPRKVFEQKQQLSVMHALNTFLALRHAHETGHDVLDWGTSPALPDDGQLQYKRQRGATLSVASCHRYLWVHLPAAHRAPLLWERPLFSVQGESLALNVGIPAASTDEEVLNRFTKLTFRGVAAIRLHAGRPVGEDLVTALRSQYSSGGAGDPAVKVLTTPLAERS